MGFPDTGRSLTYSLLYVQLNWVSTSILSTWSFGWVEIMPKTQMFWCFAFPGIYGISWFCWVFQSLHVSWSRVPMFLQVLDFNPEGPELDPHHWCIHGSHSPPTRPLVFFQSYTKKTKLWDFFRKKNDMLGSYFDDSTLSANWVGHGECVETQEISIDELDIGAVDLVGGPGEVNRIPPEDLRLRLWEFTIDVFFLGLVILFRDSSVEWPNEWNVE